MPAIELENLSAPLANWPLTRAVVVFDVGVAVSEGVDSGLEVQLQLVEVLAIRVQLLLSLQTLVLFLLHGESEFVFLLGHEDQVLLTSVGGVEKFLLLQVQIFFSDGDFFVHPDSLQLKPVLEFEEVLETQDVATKAGFLAFQLALDFERFGSFGAEGVLDHSDFLLPAGGIGALESLESLHLALRGRQLKGKSVLLAFEEILGGLLFGFGFDDSRLVFVDLLLEKTDFFFRLQRCQFRLGLECFDLSFLDFDGVGEGDFLGSGRLSFLLLGVT